MQPTMEQLEVGMDDPQLMQLQATEDASPEQEQMLGEHLASVMDYLYSEKGMAAIVNAFNQDERPLFESVPQIASMILEKEYSKMQQKGEVDSTIFFGEGGLLQQLPPLLFDIAAQIGRPGAEDPDQLSAAVIGLYKRAGEHIMESGDADAIAEAHALGAETLMTQQDGSIASPETLMKASAPSGGKQGGGLLGL